MEPWTSDNPSLTRAFAPVFDERDDAGLAVEGKIPAQMRGVFMRNGPNPQFEPDDHYAYPFDGTGMIHAVYIEDGQARYRNRWVLTKELAQERAAGRRLFHSTLSAPPHANLANTHIIHHGGRYLALFEGGAPYELDRDLNTIGVFDYGGTLPGVMSAHPKVDPLSGALFSVQYDLETGELLYLRADKAGRLDRSVPFQSSWPAMVHDIALTEHYVVAFVCPLVFDFSLPGPPATWQPERRSMVALIPRDAHAAQDVRWINGPAFFHWHVINAHEEGSRIEVVLPWYDSFSLTGGDRKLELHRIIVNTDTGTVEDQTIDDQACEFGRINDSYLGRKARYCYVGLRAPHPGRVPQMGTFEAIARYDLATGKKTVHQFPPGVTVGEPVFVAQDDGVGEDVGGGQEGGEGEEGSGNEDDGYIVTFAHTEGSSQGSFVILDARHIEHGPIAVIRLPRRVPAGLHGSWVPSRIGLLSRPALNSTPL